MEGGVAQHTDELVKRIRLIGYHTSHESWASQFPRRLFKGKSVPISVLRENSNVYFSLWWWNIFSWITAGVRNRNRKLIFCSATPFQYPIFLVILAFNSRYTRRKSILVAHNVMPHESSFLDSILTRLLFRSVGTVLVHGDPEAKKAEEIAPGRISVAPLPLHSTVRTRIEPDTQIHYQILFIGFVRKYKGLDLLLESLQFIDSKVNLVVAGRFWEDTRSYEQIVDRLSLSNRVAFIDRYVSEEELEQLIDESDCVVLPYRSATSSQIPAITRKRLKPSVVTHVGGLAELVNHGHNGLIVHEGTPECLAEAINSIYEGNKALDLRRGCVAPDGVSEWADYLSALKL